MSKNWMRHLEIQLTDAKGLGITLSDFKVTFSIDWFNLKYPSVAMIRIYNLSHQTANRIMGKEFSKVSIIAGYDGLAPEVNENQIGIAIPVDPSQAGQRDGQNYGLIYNGDIRFTIAGRDNPTDTYVLVQASDGLGAYMNATISTTIAKGYTVEDIYNLLLRTLAPFGIAAGLKPVFPTTVFPRGRTFHGMVRDYMDNVAEQCGATWQFVNSHLDMMTPKMITHEAIVLNSKTGLIGMPQQTIGAGVNVRCLINPNIRVNGLIQLNQESVYQVELSKTDIQAVPSATNSRYYTGVENGNVVVGTLDERGNLLPPTSPPASIATDGVYFVRSISYTGDTRGQAWYMDMMCEARGAQDLTTQISRERGL